LGRSRRALRVAVPEERTDMPTWLLIVIIIVLVVLVVGYFMRGRRGAV
jgi:Mg2+ and Co2+ transporter CorA